MKRKNILFITSDQQRADTIGLLNDKIKTPNLDKLAKDGMLFTRGYTVNPVCTPTRVSMLTGEFPSRHGCYTIGTSLPENYEFTVPRTLSENGYFTSLIGKAHFQACMHEDSLESEPKVNDSDFFRNWSGDYYGFEYAKLIIGHGDESKSGGMHYGAWLKDKGVDVSKYFGNTPYYSYGKWDLPDELSSGMWTYEETVNAIDISLEQGKPFFIWSSFQNPHNPCYTPEPWASMYDDVELPEYNFVEGEFDDKPNLYKCIRQHDSTAKNPKYLPTTYGEDLGKKDWHCVSSLSELMDGTGERQVIMKQYYAMVSQMDHYIGKIIDYLKEKNLYDDTIIVFTSDHGDYMGNHGLWWKGVPAFEDIHNVPFIVRHPDCKTKGEISDKLQSVIDIPSTILDVAGVKLPSYIQGKSAEASWCDSSISARNSCIIEFRPTEHEYMQTVMITEKYKLVVYANREYGELYDLENDKDQYKNLWDLDDYKQVKSELFLQLISAEMDKNCNYRTRFCPA